MLRRLFDIATVISLLLLIAAILLQGRTESLPIKVLAFGFRGVDYRLVSDRGTLGIDNQPQLEAFSAGQAARFRALVAQRNGLLSSGLFVGAIKRDQDRILVRVGSTWLGVGDVVTADGIRVEIARIARNGITIKRNGTPEFVKIGQSLSTSEMQQDDKLKRQLLSIASTSPPALTRLAIPYWLLALCFATVPAAWLFRFERRQHYRPTGRCTACGYNLTGNVSGVCPECGTPVTGTAGVSR